MKSVLDIWCVSSASNNIYWCGAAVAQTASAVWCGDRGGVTNTSEEEPADLRLDAWTGIMMWCEKKYKERQKKKKLGDFFMVKKNMQEYGEKYSNVRVQITGPYILPGKQCWVFFGVETCCLIIWKQILRLWRSNHMGMNIYFRLDLKVEHPAIRIVKNWNRLLWGWNYWRFLKAG